MIDLLAELQRIAALLKTSEDRQQLEKALDDVEYLIEALDPELQQGAYDLHEKLRDKLDN